jgi:hypothetical protein
MTDDIVAVLARLMALTQVESASVTVVLKPVTPPSPLPDAPLCVFKIGPVSSKE